MKAVILAAGQGTRLMPLTNRVPKCLVRLHGKPIMQRQLESLDKAGFDQCVIVVGYRGDQVEYQFGPRFRNLEITYVNNERYEETNNLYSLWLARNFLDDDILLLECDLVFEDGLLKDIAQRTHPDIAVVDWFNSTMDGTVILAQEGLAESMVLKSQQSEEFDYRYALKTVNIYSLSRDTMVRRFLPALDRHVDIDAANAFYEAALAELVSQGKLKMAVHLTGDRKWTEVDTVGDLHEAEALFPTTSPARNGNAIEEIAESIMVKSDPNHPGQAKYDGKRAQRKELP